MAASFLLAACVPPKAIIADQSLLPADAPPPAVAPAPEVEIAAAPVVPTPPDHGLRLPADILSLPGDGEFRATNPSVPGRAADAGPVISRPPTDPPPRLRPPETEEPED